ncbi:D-hexose-6-phosphate mutarotase [Verrucomicrobia bacterium]|jgi:glucose-6-phosphate 1-epimerase|nr:D-hexose-6-phosphate mutarotase [Verrucomicrobiota bacterium]MDA7657263.1 D-hexose-6-phosphate mutarotase [Verrucomicrobiota bacterium]MDA7680588.1 D-hexose-6-phosphate mutarotase [bacterium]
MNGEDLNLSNGNAGIRFLSDPGGLPVVELRGKLGSVSVALNGAHVLEYKNTEDHSILWVSQEAVYETGKPIRGGIPICWPWFGPHGDDPKKPAHGLARISEWKLCQTGAVSDKDATFLEFSLVDTEWSRSLWPYSFELVYRVSLLPDALEISLTTKNTDDRSFMLTAALHSYFGIKSIEEATVDGLDGVTYLDQLDGMATKRQKGKVQFIQEVDRVYVDAPSTTMIQGSTSGRSIEVESRGSRSTVVWNPWIEKAKRMGDFGDSEYQEMVCVETANAGLDKIMVQPGGRHELTAILRIR